MRLPRFIRALIGQATSHAYDTVKANLLADNSDLPTVLATVTDGATARIVSGLKADIRPNFERAALFFILFRAQADQSRRIDALDATLGVFLLAILTIAPFAFDKAPADIIDRVVVGLALAIPAVLVIRALFFIRSKEADPSFIAVKMLLNLDTPDQGSLHAVREEIKRQADRKYTPSREDQLARGAAGDLVQLISEDQRSIRRKRRYLGVALVAFLHPGSGMRLSRHYSTIASGGTNPCSPR